MRAEPFGELQERRLQPRDVELAVRPRVRQQIPAVDELHREEPQAVVMDELAEGDQVDVVQIRERAELVLEAHQLDAAERAQRLQGDARLALAIEDVVDDAHPARAEARQHLEARRACEFGGELCHA